MVVLSGGQDSTTCLFWALQRYYRVEAMVVDYGQRHSRELDAAVAVAGRAFTTVHMVKAPNILHSASPLTDPGATLEQYPDAATMAKTIGDRVELTFVPMRNAFFLTLAANRAVALGIRELVTGVCQADNANYPDCRREFIDHQEDTINMALGLRPGVAGNFRITTPLMYMTKAESIRLALSTPGAYSALAYSHTAYDGQYPPVGHDHATVLRADGFEQAGVPDPLVLRAVWAGLMPMPFTANYNGDALAKGRRALESDRTYGWPSSWLDRDHAQADGVSA